MSTPESTMLPLTSMSAQEIVNGLPAPVYAENYQPTYANEDQLVEAVAELQATQPVTNPEQIDALQHELTELALGKIRRPIVITASCAEDVSLSTAIERLVDGAVHEHQLIMRALPNVIAIRRDRGQTFKPRSSATETLGNGRVVTSFMGDGINAKDPDHREPDPSRLVATALQSRDLEQGLTEAVGEHVPAAHEALSLAYETAFKRTDPKTGRTYLVSTDLPWIGKRTNQCTVNPEIEEDSAQVELLTDVANPIGIKIGADSTPEHIAALQAKLNPNNIPGKLLFMIRTGPQQQEALHDILSGIREHAPHALLMYDIHGVTRTAPTGEKIRYTGDIINDIRTTAQACKEAGLKLHGLHLETVADDSRLECVDEPDQLPHDAGNVDPRLNPRQLEHVLEQTKDYLL